MKPLAILLMGPTASGKTDIAVRLAQHLPCDLISVDSALVYRGMDIGTAKPTGDELRHAPHQLIDIRDPEEPYSAGDFVRGATAAMTAIFTKKRIPLLVGGTMMYFRALTRGIADLPRADAKLRGRIDTQAGQVGWPAMHANLAKVDPASAGRLSPNDSQRIQRALEVYELCGTPISELHKQAAAISKDIDYVKIALRIEPRAVLHDRIAARLDAMIAAGFPAEMRTLMSRPGLKRDSPAMRAVGYRQFWRFLEGDCTASEARDKALFATRQLAKRQLTWLRSENDVFSVNPLEDGAFDTILSHLKAHLP
jgi:tRNA dimethylallyltransferase